MTGSGTLADPYVIWDVFDLQDVNLDLTAWYELGADIDAAVTVGWNGGLGFDPIDNFTGHFDGQNYTITALFINRNDPGAGLFELAQAATFLNVGLINCNITNILGRVGALGSEFYGCTVANCYSTGTITANRSQIGGLIGFTWSFGGVRTTIEDCWSSCIVSQTGAGLLDWGCGGLVGRAFQTDFTNCYATGAVSAVLTWTSTGGLVGDADSCTVDECHATGTVIGLNETGGLVGWVAGSTTPITNSYATGNVSGRWRVGGVLGDGFMLSNCYATGAVQGEADVGGLAGYVGDVTDCYATGTVTGIFIGWNPHRIGGLVGSFQGTATRCHATGNVASTPGDTVGGLMGLFAINTDAHACYATGGVSIINGGNSIGSFAGYCDTGVIVDTSYSTGNISCTGAGNIDRVGGFCGENYGTLTNCYTLSQVTAVAAMNVSRLAGFVGYNEGTINRCYVAASMTLAGPTALIGGLVGEQVVPGTTIDSFWDIELSGLSTSAAGTGEITTTMKKLATFADAGWDIQENSAADFGNGYPWLSWQMPGSSPVWYILPSAVPPAPVTVVTLPATEVRA